MHVRSLFITPHLELIGRSIELNISNLIYDDRNGFSVPVSSEVLVIQPVPVVIKRGTNYRLLNRGDEKLLASLKSLPAHRKIYCFLVGTELTEKQLAQYEFLLGVFLPAVSSFEKPIPILKTVQADKSLKKFISSAICGDRKERSIYQIAQAMGSAAPSRNTIKQHLSLDSTPRKRSNNKLKPRMAVATSTIESVASRWDDYARANPLPSFAEIESRFADKPHYLSRFIERLENLDFHSDDFKIFLRKVLVAYEAAGETK